MNFKCSNPFSHSMQFIQTPEQIQSNCILKSIDCLGSNMP